MSKGGVVEEEVDWVVHIYCAIYWPNIEAEMLYVVPQIDPSVKLYNHGEGPGRGLLRDCTTGCETDGALHSTNHDDVIL